MSLYLYYRYTKANSKYMINYDKNKESSYLKYCDGNNLYCYAMSKKLPINSFEWIQDVFQFNEDFIKNHNEKSNEGYILEIDI